MSYLINIYVYLDFMTEQFCIVQSRIDLDNDRHHCHTAHSSYKLTSELCLTLW